MKIKFIFFSVLALVITILIVLTSKNINTNNERAKAYTKIKYDDFNFLVPIPEYELNENSVICFFSTSCELCSYESEILKEHIPANTDFIWVSTENNDKIKGFIADNKLENQENFLFASIDSTLLRDKYGVYAYPRGLIYKNGILEHVYKGVIQADDLKHYLFDNSEE